MDKQDKQIQDLVARKSAFKRIFSLFQKQPVATNLVYKRDAVLPEKDQEIFGKSDASLQNSYNNAVYGTYLAKISTKKRIMEYAQMSFDAELSYALEEIVDEMCIETEEGKLYKLEFGSEVKDPAKDILFSEFKDLIINRLHLGDYNRIWAWAMKWLVQGVLIFKINFSKEAGTGVESLEEIQPWLVSETKKEGDDKTYYIIKENEEAETGMTYDPSEILKIDSGHYYDGEYFSILEFAKKDWRRLNLMEDATVIYKLSRSPMRRVFKVYVGKMAPKDIEIYLESFRSRIREDISYDPQKGEIIGLNPITILDDFFFPVIEGGQAVCDVDTLVEKDSGWDAQDDIRYFLGKVYRSMRIPVGRMNIPNQNGDVSTQYMGSKAGEIMRDEIKFSNFVKRLQNRFLEQFVQEVFYRHLLFRVLLEELEVKKDTVQVKFLYKSPYVELKNAEVEDYRMYSFAQINGANEMFSFEFLVRKYLKWTDQEIKENYRLLKKEFKFKMGLGAAAGGEGAPGAGGGGMPLGGGASGGMGGDLGVEPEAGAEDTTPLSGGEGDLVETPPTGTPITSPTK
jgi:hypothetical protein